MGKGHHGRCAVCGARLRNRYIRVGDEILSFLVCTSNPHHQEQTVGQKA